MEGLAQVAQHDAVLRPARAGHRGTHAAKVELQDLVELGGGTRQAPQALLPRVRLHQADVGLVPAGQAQVGECLVVDGEDARRGPVLGRHVGQRGPVGERQ